MEKELSFHLTIHLPGVLVVSVAAALAPILTYCIPRVRVPIVVMELLLGLIVGPQLLDLADPSAPAIKLLSWYGIAFLFFLAGFEIDFDRMRGKPVSLSSKGWMLSLTLALAVTFGLLLPAGLIDRGSLFVAAALTTTSLGALIPILKDARETESRFGTYTIASGAMGEFGPIVLMALFLGGNSDKLSTVLWLMFFVVVTIGSAGLAMSLRHPRIAMVMKRSLHTSAQLPIRLALLLLASLVFLTEGVNLDMLLGAFAAGIVVALACKQSIVDTRAIRSKFEGIGYGFFVPIFFVASGMQFDLDSLIHEPETLALMPLFLLLFLLVRGLPALLYRHELPRGDLLPLGLMAGTALPLVVAITHIGVAKGELDAGVASAMVGAGMISVLLYPLLALTLHARVGHVPSHHHQHHEGTPAALPIGELPAGDGAKPPPESPPA